MGYVAPVAGSSETPTVVMLISGQAANFTVEGMNDD
jgi:hypothetical protein